MNGQELRNCLYAGNFNDLVTNTLSADPVFTAIWGIPTHRENIDKAGKPSEELRKNSLYKRMLDCELVLRFFAFRKSSNIKGSVRAMLDRLGRRYFVTRTRTEGHNSRSRCMTE